VRQILARSLPWRQLHVRQHVLRQAARAHALQRLALAAPQQRHAAAQRD
jgi:hypothetical protein